MSARKKQTGVNSLPLRNASDFYTIALDDEYTLTEAILEKSVDRKTSRAGGWFFPELELLSFKDGTAEILNRSDKAVFKFYMKVEPYKLRVACSCGVQVEALCIHVLKALSRMVVYDDLGNLKKFMPNGAMQIVLANRRFFEKKPGLQNMFKPKAALGSVYGIEEALGNYSIEDVLALPAPLPSKIEIPETSMCYIIMYSRRNDFLPFLLPCMGKLNKAGDSIKNFGNFLSGIQKEYDAMLTTEQRELNRLGLDMWKRIMIGKQK
jgi:hypothetical protein